MSTCTRKSRPRALELPEPFEDLTGVISADLRVIVTALAQRAGERMLLSPRQRQQLQQTLWDNLTRVVNETMEPLGVERH
ncbi:MAG: hypothetical protein ACLQGP_13810 [Isosphaeraceae bacterium]